MELMETPCIDICQIDQQSRLCRGCGRSIDEITMWGSMSDAERRRIMGELKARMLSFGVAEKAGDRP
jgi:uncharacterized protein